MPDPALHLSPPDLPLDVALKRLTRALDHLEAAFERLTRVGAERRDLEDTLAMMQDDRSRLALELDAALGHANTLERTTDEVAARLSNAGRTLRRLLDSADEHRQVGTVAVTIAGRSYRIACGEGEEEHLLQLARHVDQTLASLRKGFGEIGDARLVIMTAITVSDELFEARRKIAELDVQLAELRASRSDGEALRHSLAVEVAASLDVVSDRIEQIAQHLNEAGKS